jgi:hypothetical protein
VVAEGGGSRVVGAPFRGGYGYYRPFYRPTTGRSTATGRASRIGFYAGYPFYGYGYYGYPYYGYPYYAYPITVIPMGISERWVPYAYPAYGGYGYAEAYAGVRIQGALPTAEVFADGNNVGIADDFDGASQRLELTPGAHSIEIRAPGMASMAYDVNVQPGRTVTLHVR